MQNAMSGPAEAGPGDVVDRLALQTLARRGAGYAAEIRRLLDAALEVMRTCGTTSRPRVADIVAAAGLSNDAFYRHFATKDALVAALLEDGTNRLGSYLAHQMRKQPTAEARVRRRVEGVLAQTDEEIAATTLAVLWNAGGVGEAAGRHYAVTPLSALLVEPFAALGSQDPAFDATLVAHATLGTLSDYLWRQTRPTEGELGHIVDFALTAVRARSSALGAAGEGRA